MAVLPASSKDLLPVAYHDLMTSENSQIIHFYPNEFETDLNGKQHEWEAVVLIPFIDEVCHMKYLLHNFRIIYFIDIIFFFIVILNVLINK